VCCQGPSGEVRVDQAGDRRWAGEDAKMLGPGSNGYLLALARWCGRRFLAIRCGAQFSDILRTLISPDGDWYPRRLLLA